MQVPCRSQIGNGSQSHLTWLQHPSTEQYRYYQRKCLSLPAVSAKPTANLLAVAACMGSLVCPFALANAFKAVLMATLQGMYF